MLTRILFGTVALALLATAFALPALAQDNRPRTSDGAIMDLSSWHAMPPHDFMLNIVDLPNAEFTGAQRRVRDKAFLTSGSGSTTQGLHLR